MSEVLNSEKLIAEYLRGVDAVDARAVAKTPEKTDTAWIRITQLDAADVGEGLERWIEYALQLDLYAGKDGGQPEAVALNQATRAALKALQGVTIAGEGVVARVHFTANPRVPDGDFEPARERFVLDTRLLMRPA